MAIPFFFFLIGKQEVLFKRKSAKPKYTRSVYEYLARVYHRRKKIMDIKPITNNRPHP